MAKTIKTFYDSQIPSHQRREFTCRIHKKICFRLPTDNTKGEKFYWVNRSCLRIGSDWAETGDCVTFLIVLVPIVALLKHQVGRNSWGCCVEAHGVELQAVSSAQIQLPDDVQSPYRFRAHYCFKYIPIEMKRRPLASLHIGNDDKIHRHFMMGIPMMNLFRPITIPTI